MSKNYSVSNMQYKPYTMPPLKPLNDCGLLGPSIKEVDTCSSNLAPPPLLHGQPVNPPPRQYTSFMDMIHSTLRVPTYTAVVVFMIN